MKPKFSSGLVFYFRLYRQYVGRKFYIFVILSFFAGVLDSIGIAAIIPLLSVDMNSGGSDKVSVAVDILFQSVGVERSLTSLLIFITIIFSAKSLMTLSQQIARGYITTWLGENLRKFYAKAYDRMKYAYYISTDAGFFNNIITTEISGMVGGFKKYSEVVVSLCNLLVYLVFSFFINFELTVIVVIFGVVVQLLFKGIRRAVSAISLGISNSNASIQNLFLQYIYNFKYLKTTASSGNLLKKLYKELAINRSLQFKNIYFNSLTVSIFDVFKVLILVGIIFFLVQVKGQKIVSILVPLLLLNRSIALLLLVQSEWQMFCSQSGSIVTLEKARELLQVNKEKYGRVSVGKFSDKIVLDKVSFAFNDKQVLSDIDLKIHKHQCVGFAGSSGSGKTTLLDLITGLLEVTSGTISLDSADYKVVNKQQMRNMFGYVTQDSVIFNDTVGNNISLWDYDLNSSEDMQRIENSLKLADCHEFVQRMPQGLQTVVGDKGVKLSGGQRQRLAIAREIYRDSEILIFDEATASLDSHSEQFIQDSVEKMLGRKTIFIVAHRLSTLKFCDVIYVLDQGRIVESGSWVELLSKDSYFSTMCTKQGIN